MYIYLQTTNVASDRRPMRVFSSKMLKSPLSRTCFHDSLVTSLTAFLLLWQHLRLTVLPCSWNCKSQSSLPKTGRRSFCARLALYAHSYWSFDIVAKHKHRSRTDSLNGRRENCYGNGRSSGCSLIELESQEETEATEARSRRTFTLSPSVWTLYSHNQIHRAQMLISSRMLPRSTNTLVETCQDRQVWQKLIFLYRIYWKVKKYTGVLVMV